MAAMRRSGRAGLVASLARPGGNITGLTYASATELIGEAARAAQGAGSEALASRGAPQHGQSRDAALEWQEIEAAARSLGLQAQLLDVRSPERPGPAFDAAVEAACRRARRRDSTVITQANQRPIADLAAKHRLPAIYAASEFVEAGGLIAYGVELSATCIAAPPAYVDKILKGAKPADLPVEQPTKFELVINLKTAKALGLTIPPSLLQRADEVIE